MDYNELLTKTDLSSVHERASTAGYDSRFIPRNMSSFNFSTQNELDNILCKPTQQEIQELYQIKKYNEIIKLLNILTNTVYCDQEKLDLIRMSEFLTNISGTCMSPNLETGDLIDDWEWNIDDL